MPLALTPPLVALLIDADRRGDEPMRRFTKTAATCLMGAGAWIASSGHPRAPWIRAAALAGIAGDILLLSHSKKGLLAGIGAFGAGHLAWLGAMRGEADSRARAATLLGFAALGGGILASQWEKLPGRMRKPVVGYAALLSQMAAQSVGLGFRHKDALPAIGGVLFLLSDVTVLRNRFLQPHWHNRLVGLPLYFAGQWGLIIGLTRHGRS